MSGFTRILFPIDFSERCIYAAPYVAALARRYQSHVLLLHVVEPMPAMYSTGGLIMEDFRELEESVKSQFANFGQDAFKGVAVERTVVMGQPSRSIVDYAVQNRIDLITMPTHGRGIFRELLMGSVTLQVLHDSNHAVLTTAHSEALPSTTGDLHSIVCAVDVGPEDLHIIETAYRLAKDYGAALHLVHAVESLQPTPEFPIDPELVDAFLDGARQRLEEMQEQCGAKCEVHVHTGDVAIIVRKAAIELSADLLVIGRGKLHHHFGRLRTHVGALVRESPCPVLSLPEGTTWK